MWGLPTISYRSGNSDGPKYYESADISFLNLLCDHVIKSSRDFDGGVLPLQVTTLPGLVSIGTAEGRYKAFHLLFF